MFENKSFIRFMQQARTQERDLVCINVLDTKGSAYRKSGAMMLVDSEGEFTGVVSGGCFEADIVACAKEVLEKNQGKYVAHDLRMKDDSLDSWGQGIGCNGLIKLWMEPFYYKEDYSTLGAALRFSEQNQTKTLVRSIKTKAPASFLDEAQATRYDEENELFYQNIKAPFKLLILGAGPGATPLLNIANTLGWHTSLCDTRGLSLNLVEGADTKVLLKESTDAENILKEHFDAAVIMSHNFEADASYLKALLETKLTYIGLMGPQKRALKLLASKGLESSFIHEERLHNPIGLDLGGESPESIALAICAEIEAKRHQKMPASLRERAHESIHG